MSRRDMLVATALVAALVGFLGPYASMGVDAHHDGIMLKPALDVLSGQVLFRDTFSQYGALTTYIQAAALAIHPTLLTLRLETLGAYGITLFILFATWRLFLPRTLTMVACTLFVLFIPAYERNWVGENWMLLPWSSVYALMFQALALYALLNVIRHEQAVRWAVMLGIATACIFWCRQPVGVLSAGCLAVIWVALHATGWSPAVHSKPRIFGAALAGYLGVHLLVLGGIWLSGAGPEWWYQNLAWPRKFAGTVAGAHWSSFSKVFLHPVAAAWLLCLLTAAAVPSVLRKCERRLPRAFELSWYAGLALVAGWQLDRVLAVIDLRTGGWTVLLPLLLIAQAVVSSCLGWLRPGVKSSEYYLVAAAAGFSLCSLAQYFPVSDTWHIAWALAPTFGVIVFSLWRWSGWPASVVAVVLAVLFTPSVIGRVRAGRAALAEPYVTLTHPAVLRGMKVPPAQAKHYADVMRALDRVLERRPDIPSVLLGNDALILCFTNNRTNPLPYYVSWPLLADATGDLKRWTYIREVRPLIFFHRANWSNVNEFYRGSRYVPIAYFDHEALEIAIPQELADTMGITAYGAPKSTPASPPLR